MYFIPQHPNTKDLDITFHYKSFKPNCIVLFFFKRSINLGNDQTAEHRKIASR